MLLSVTELLAEGVDMSFLLHCWKLSYQVEEWYVKLAVSRPSEGNGITGSEKKKIGFCIMVETFGNPLCCESKSQSLIYSVCV